MTRAQTLKSIALDCNDLIRVRDCFYQPGEGAAGYGFVTLVILDYVGSPLTINTIEHHLFKSKSTIPEMTALKWGRSVANGLKYMHSHGLIHGNIKPSNVILDDVGHASLGDYPFPKSTAPQPLMKKTSIKSDIFEFGLLLYYIVTGGAIIPLNEYEECHMNEMTMLRLIPVRFGNVLKEVLSLSLYQNEDDEEDAVDAVPGGAIRSSFAISNIYNILHHRIRELELITELYNSRVLLLDNALNVIDDDCEGFYLKKDLCHAILKNTTVRAILSQDVELMLLIGDPTKVGRFIMKMATKRGDGDETQYVEADDILKLVKQMTITKNRDEAEQERVRLEEKRIADAEAELEKKKKRK